MADQIINDESRTEQIVNDENKPLLYVGIGASAGGLEALESFFTHMPPESGLAFIVIQHLSPDYKSMMVELLGKRTAMKVCRAEEGMVVEADTVYLIPPRKLLTIFHGKLLLRDTDHNRGINLPIDVFLRSLAEDQGDKGVAVILSGTGSDGVRGVRAVKEAGGLILVQNEESAKFDGMPRAAIGTGLVDIILPPEEMPERLLAMVNTPMNVKLDRSRDSLLVSDEDNLTKIYAMLREHSHVDFTYYKRSTINRRIERRMTVNQVHDLAGYVQMLHERPGEVNILYRELLIGVTSFFRDREVFDDLAETYLPQVIKNAQNGTLRFWVTGCSTGEEAYTLAILARECMDKMGVYPDLKIFATDIDREALIYAGNGQYPESIAADLPTGVIGKYFIHMGDTYKVIRPVREMVVFAHHNIIKDPPFTKIDLLSCRNLLIYLETILQQKVMSFFNFSLNPKGILLLGSSETPGEMITYFETLNQRHKIYRSLGKKRLPSEVQSIADPPYHKSTKNFRSLGLPRRELRSAQEEERVQERLLQSVAGDYLPLVAVVNDKMELVHLVGNWENLLFLPPGKIVYDIAKMVPKEIGIPLSTGLQKVFNHNDDVKYSNIRFSVEGKTNTIQMHIRRLAGRKNQEPLAAVFVSEVKKEECAPGTLSGTDFREYDISKEAENRIRDLEQELQFTKENLQATIEELETSNEELQATNEELLASNEELQSTNEELQSVNEELHTVNYEYQGKIMELTEMTNDLDNLIASTHIGTIFLDENLEVRKYTEEITGIYRIQASDLGRHFSNFKHEILNIEPLDIIKRVVKTGKMSETEVQCSDGKWYLMNVLPYDVGGNEPSGIIVTFSDITSLKESEQKLRDEREQLTSMFDSINHIVYVADINSYEILYANKAVRDNFGDDIVGKLCYNVLQEKTAPCDFCTNDIIRKIHYKPYEWEHYNPLTRRWYSLTDQMVHWPGGRDVRFQLAVDITDKKKAEDDLKREQAILTKTQRLTKVGGWEWDLVRQKMYWTEQVYIIHGFDPDEFAPGSDEHISRSIECYHPEDRIMIEEAFKKCCEEGKPYSLECRFTDINGNIMRIKTMGEPGFDEDGKVVKVMGNIMIIEL